MAYELELGLWSSQTRPLVQQSSEIQGGICIMANERKVVFITPVIHHYRGKFHDLLRMHLRDAGIIYEVIRGAATDLELNKGDLIEPAWASKIVQKRWHIRNTILSYHPVIARVRKADMVILMQENKHLQNYLLQVLPKQLRPLLGMMGHGRNFQSRRPGSVAERWKQFWALKVDWWFGYTEETRAHLNSLGFPSDRITIFNNSVDTSEMRQQVAAATPERLETLRAELKLGEGRVGIFVGGIYPDKRINFLIKSADAIREIIPDFQLIVIGGGSDLPLVEALAENRPWLRVMGPRFGQAKVDLIMLGHVFMMPGLMGLAILDAGIAGLPIATTSFPWHSPEIAYLDADRNGLKVKDWQDPIAYGMAVASLLKDDDRRKAMAQSAREMADRYSVEAMAENFAQGIKKALGL